jgi:hypothetical protein
MFVTVKRRIMVFSPPGVGVNGFEFSSSYPQKRDFLLISYITNKFYVL